jgi:hypothetical protein
MCSKQLWIQPDASDPLRHKPGILARCHIAVRTATSGEQELSGSCWRPSNNPQWPAGFVRSTFKPGRPSSFLLPDGRAVGRTSTGGDIFDPKSNDITTTKLAIDCQVAHG